MRTLLPSCVVLALVACTMIPTTNPPQQAVPHAWHDSAGSRAATAAPETPWWSAFPDTTLRGLIRSALARNTDLRSAAENVTTAQEYVRVARARLYPSVTADASLGTSRSWSESHLSGDPAGPDSRASYDRWSAGLFASWYPDVAGAQRSEIAASRAQLQASEEDRRGISLAIVSSVASAYADLRAADRMRTVLERTLADRLRVLDVALRRAGSGASGDVDVLQARTQVESARQNLRDVAESGTHGENALSLLVGRSPGAVARPAADDDNPLAIAVPASLPSELLQRRPDVRAAEHALAAASADVGAMRAGLFPQLAISGGASFAGNTSESANSTTGQSNSYVSTSRGWNLGVSLSQALFAGGGNVAIVRVAESRARLAAIAYETTVLRALRDAEDALASVRYAADRRASLDSQVVLTRAARQLAEERYERGEARFLDVLYAQGAQLGAETGAVSAWSGQVQAFIRLYQALGGGWESEAAGGPAPAH